MNFIRIKSKCKLKYVIYSTGEQEENWKFRSLPVPNMKFSINRWKKQRVHQSQLSLMKSSINCIDIRTFFSYRPEKFHISRVVLSGQISKNPTNHLFVIWKKNLIIEFSIIFFGEFFSFMLSEEKNVSIQTKKVIVILLMKK